MSSLKNQVGYAQKQEVKGAIDFILNYIQHSQHISMAKSYSLNFAKAASPRLKSNCSWPQRARLGKNTTPLKRAPLAFLVHVRIQVQFLV